MICEKENDLRGVVPGTENFQTKSDEQRVISEWENAPVQIDRYPEGSLTLSSGDKYRYNPGRRLTIRGEQVMDDCETPWAAATINTAFSELRRRKTDTIRVLELGFGLGITASWIIRRFLEREGRSEYVGVELNKDVFRSAQEWQRNIEAGLKAFRPVSPDIKFLLLQGDSRTVTVKLAEERKQRCKFDIIISDTYPIKKGDEGINDLKDLDVLTTCLAKDGVFAFFPFFPESDDPNHFTHEQRRLIAPYFQIIRTSDANINPPEKYKYLWHGSEPVRKLPVAVAIGPRL